jgi:arabinogalactan oligomer / maltooligosaccharide transport system substrate-binding protein
VNTKIRMASLVAAVAIMAAACSNGAATTAPSTAPSTAASAAPSTAASSGPAVESPSTAAYPAGDIKILFWTKEGDPSLAFVKKLTTDYTALHKNVSFTVVNKDVEKLRTEFQATSLAGNAPDLLWTVSDHVGPFTTADLILPLDGLVDTSTYVPNTISAVTADGKLWGVPISNGNQLMLYWNKTIAGDTIPADSDALAAAAKTYTDAAAGKYGLVFNQTESFWLAPFLGGYNGSVFAEDGVTPTLNTDAMKSALTLLHTWKFTDQITPPEADYNGADGLFKAGKAAFIINGDWAMADYVKAFPDKLGVGPIPTLTGGSQPKPYTAGAFFMVSKAVGSDADKQTVILDFMKWATAKEQQVALVNTLQRLPANAEALADPVVTGNPLLAGAAQAVQLGVPQPTNLQMRCVFDAMTAGVRDLFAKSSSDPAAIAASMQKQAETGVAPGGACSSQ